MFAKAIVWESEKPAIKFARNTALILFSSLFIGLLGQLAIPLPFTPVPIVTQLQAILLLGVLMGSRRAALTVAAFLAEGAMGLPVFAGGGAGIAKLIGPTGGYLIGYLVAAFVVGALLENIKEKSLFKAFLSIVGGNLIVYLLGAAYLATFVGMEKAFMLGIAPFLIGDVLKNIACVKVLQWVGWDRK